jgi:serine/threonine-protein kinase
MAEEVMNALVRVAGIRVASRTSAFRAGREEKDLAAIGRALSVDQVLEGSVRTAGGRLRVTARLSDVVTGYQVWSERYDRGSEDVFAVQDEIAAGVVDAVKARLSSGEHAVPARSPGGNLEAYRAYLQGRYLRHTKNDSGGALRAFEEAVSLDPSFGPAWVGVAESTVLAAHYSLVPARDAYARATAALATARSLQGETADGLYVDGFRAHMEGDWPAADAAYHRALELEPRHVQALGSYGLILYVRGRVEEAFALLARAREADPLAAFPYAITGAGLVAVGRPHEAERFFEIAFSFEKDNALALWSACVGRIAMGRYEEGIAAAERAVAVTRRGSFFVGVLGWALATTGCRDEARTLLEELRARPAPAPTAVSEAWLLGALGERDAAFEVLARAIEERQAGRFYVGLPAFDALRNDPRFDAYVEQVLPSRA